MALSDLASRAGRPHGAATGLSAVLLAVFGVLTEFGVPLTDRQITVVVTAVGVLGSYLVAVTGNRAVAAVVADPEVPTRPEAAGVEVLDPERPGPWQRGGAHRAGEGGGTFVAPVDEDGRWPG